MWAPWTWRLVEINTVNDTVSVPDHEPIKSEQTEKFMFLCYKTQLNYYISLLFLLCRYLKALIKLISDVVCAHLEYMFTCLCFSGSEAVNTVEQTVLIVHEEEKKSYVFDFIRNMLPQDKVLIFVGKKLV